MIADVSDVPMGLHSIFLNALFHWVGLPYGVDSICMHRHKTSFFDKIDVNGSWVSGGNRVADLRCLRFSPMGLQPMWARLYVIITCFSTK